jgi:8-oxo-dGTP pyrophosphatase MutT (NUDIX family)
VTQAKSAEIRIAATIMLVREAPALEVLMVRRHHQIDFMPGAMVFPGGKISLPDSDPRWAQCALGWDGVPEIERAPRIAAIREAFEETGIFFGTGGGDLGSDDARLARKKIEDGSLNFLDYVERRQSVLDLRGLTLFSRWLTPPIMPKRFDTFFYLAAAPSDQTAEFDGREAVDAEWIAPREALALAAKGERSLVFPTRMNLEVLARAESLAAAVEAASKRTIGIVTPRVETRGADRYLVLDPDAGYGHVSELIKAP